MKDLFTDVISKEPPILAIRFLYSTELLSSRGVWMNGQNVNLFHLITAKRTTPALLILGPKAGGEFYKKNFKY